MPESVVVAAIAAASAVAGTLAGSIVTYEGNITLQNRQVEQEAKRQQAAARAVVKLLMTEYQTDGKQLEDMVAGHEYSPYSYRERTFVSHIGEEDRKLLAGDLSEHDWVEISEAGQAIEAVWADLEAHRGKGKLGAEALEIFERTHELCQAAYKALTPVAEGKPA